ncbi:MAG TPA: hypothetical protein ENK45_00085 [Aliiroseovarius sp.]|nr:hypothetical protein [Aliiroseovarius sp.]
MRRLFTPILAGALTLGFAAQVAAEPVTPKEAKKLLFKGPKISVQVLSPEGVAPEIMAQVEAIAASLTKPEIIDTWEKMGFSLAYYGAIAIKPDRPVNPANSMTMSNNLHSPQAAANAAARACNALPGPDCVVVALITPKRFKPRDFTLSQAATDGFRENWGKPDAPQYLAFSPSSGTWLIAKGAGADAVALERCNEKAVEGGGTADCQIAIAEE